MDEFEFNAFKGVILEQLPILFEDKSLTPLTIQKYFNLLTRGSFDIKNYLLYQSFVSTDALVGDPDGSGEVLLVPYDRSSLLRNIVGCLRPDIDLQDGKLLVSRGQYAEFQKDGFKLIDGFSQSQESRLLQTSLSPYSVLDLLVNYSKRSKSEGLKRLVRSGSYFLHGSRGLVKRELGSLNYGLNEEFFLPLFEISRSPGLGFIKFGCFDNCFKEVGMLDEGTLITEYK